jgi:hypothetical protein
MTKRRPMMEREPGNVNRTSGQRHRAKLDSPGGVEHDAAMFTPGSRRRSPWLIAAFLGLAAVAGSVAFATWPRGTRPAPLAPVVILPASYTVPKQPVSLFNRIVPARPGWGWLWHLKEFVTGRRKTVDLRAWVLSLTNSPSFSVMAGKPEASEANGVQIWLLETNQIKTLRLELHNAGIESIFSPGVSTADACEAIMFTGNNIPFPSAKSAGLTLDFLPRVRKNAIDLIAITSISEFATNNTSSGSDAAAATQILATKIVYQGTSLGPGPVAVSVRTNFSFAARIQLTNGGGAFILGADRSEPEAKRIGILLIGSLPGK